MINKIRILALGFLVAALSACNKQDDVPIRISINAWPGYEFLYLAEQKGFFREEGVNVQLVQFGSLSDTRRAFERGKIDGMAATLIEVLQARDISGRTPQVYLVSDYSDGADVIVAQPAIKTLADLKGQKVGLELASLGVFMLGRALEQAGLTLDDVQLYSSDQSSMAEMFARQELAAVVSYPPVSMQIQTTPGVNTVFTSHNIPGEVIDVLAMDSTLLQRQPEKAAAIVRAFYRAVDYAKSHQDEAYRLMGEREGISAQAFREALETGINMIPLTAQQDYFAQGGKLETALKNVQNALIKTGQLQNSADLQQVINRSPVDMATGKTP